MTDEMTDEERAVWVGDRLWGVIKYNVGIVDVVRYRYPSNQNRERTLDYYLEWISSPDGIHAIKQAMIDRGWFWEVCYSNIDSYLCSLAKLAPYLVHDAPSSGYKVIKGKGKTEAEAVIAAAYEALNSEGE